MTPAAPPKRGPCGRNLAVTSRAVTAVRCLLTFALRCSQSRRDKHMIGRGAGIDEAASVPNEHASFDE